MKRITFDIKKMIKLRQRGMGFAALGRKFHKDHTTIMYHCRKLGVVPHQPVPIATRRMQFTLVEEEVVGFVAIPKVAHKYDHLIFEKANKGKSYKEYLADALKRPIEKQYHKIYNENTEVSGILPRRSSRSAASFEEERGEDFLPDLGLV